MSFQGYLDSIEAKTGLKPDDFRRIATQKGFYIDGRLTDGTKAGAIVAWLKAEHDLGHGHAMAIYALLKGRDGDKKGG